MRTRSTALLATLLLTLAAGFLILRHVSEPAPAANTDTGSGRDSLALGAGKAVLPPMAAVPAEPAPGPGDTPKTPDQLSAHLRERYGAHIDKPYVQIRMIEELMQHFQRQRPNDWQAALLEALRNAFPERYDELAARLQQRIDYERWMDEHRARLRGVSAEEQRAALWEARTRIFGAEAAEAIWASELRNQAVSQALEAIDTQPGAPIADKLGQYKQALEDIYQEHADRYMESRQHEVLNRFIGLGSVQAELSAMSPEERARSLRTIRTELGLDEAALARWDELDRIRDARWEAGRRYMDERAALVGRYAGDELESRLRELRARHFGAEAEIIASEEAAGFFRFDQPRRWGQN